jgi:hypothetical protein
MIHMQQESRLAVEEAEPHEVVVNERCERTQGQVNAVKCRAPSATAISAPSEE